MAEPRPDGLPYGQLGEPVYNATLKQWSFSRQPKEVFSFKPVGSYVTSIPPTAITPSNRRTAISAQLLKQQAKLLATRHPELTPGLDSVGTFAHTSHHIASLTAVHDPLISDRLAFGRAAFEATTTNIIAISAGQAGDVLRLIRVKLAQYSCGYDEISSIAVPEIDTRDEGWWSGESSVIQQITCAEGASTCMAVRLLCSTVILRPHYRSTTESWSKPRCQGHGNLPSFRLHANPVLELSVDQTGGVPHADVNFNPWHQRQVAIVDQQGAWSVWELLTQEQEGDNHQAKSVAMGHIFDGHESEVPSQYGGDGWGAVRFVGSSDTLVVCNRMHMAIIHVPSRLAQLDVLNLDLSRTSDWILDVRRSSRNRSHLFVVTSSQVFCIHVAATGKEEDKGKTQAVATTLRSWCHFRASGDTSLHLEVSDHERGMAILRSGQERITETLQGYVLLLYSRLNSLITIFQLSYSSDSMSHTIITLDPQAISLSSAAINQYHFSSSGAVAQNQSSISNIALQPAPHKGRVFEGVQTSDPDANAMTEGISFYKLLMLRSDLSVCDCVYVGRTGKPIHGRWAFGLDRLSRTRSHKSTTLTVDDRMIVSGNGKSSVTEQVDTGEKDLVRKHKQTPNPQPDDSPADDWTVNSELLYELVTETTRSKALTMSSLVVHEQDRQLSPELIRELIDSKCKDGALGIQSLFEILDRVPDYTDVDDAASRVEGIRESVARFSDIRGEGHTLDSEEPGSPEHLDLNIRSDGHLLPLDPSLSCMYDYLVENWLRSLHSGLPGRTRIARERVLRRLAMILCLARAGVNLPAGGNPSRLLKADRTTPGSRQLNLPVRQRETADDLSMTGNGRIERASSSPPHSSQLSVDAGFHGATRLGDNESKTRSSPSASAIQLTSHPANSSNNTEDPACVRLRQYTTVNFQPRLPPSMSRVLSHWAQGSDPAHYDWSIATASATAPNNIEDDADKNRRKSALRRGRLSKSRQGGPVKSASQPNPPRLWGSQPQLLHSVPSSSQLVEDFAPMSQVERGPHGGRQDPSRKQRTKPDKARRAGF